MPALALCSPAKPDRSLRVATTEQIIDEARNGRMFILADDEDRENEGDLIIPAQMATPDAIDDGLTVPRRQSKRFVSDREAGAGGAVTSIA